VEEGVLLLLALVPLITFKLAQRLPVELAMVMDAVEAAEPLKEPAGLLSAESVKPDTW